MEYKNACIINTLEHNLLITTHRQLDAETVLRGIIALCDELPTSVVKTIMFDNGKKFAQYKTIEEVLGCTAYYADPYAE